MPLFNEICNFLSNDPHPEFNYNAKPIPTEKELTAISAALDTIMITMFHCKCSTTNISTLKFNMAIELSQTHDIATPEFIKWYENLFTNLTERTKGEVSKRTFIDFDIIEKIKLQADKIDYELFTKTILFIRSQLADNLNYCLSDK